MLRRLIDNRDVLGVKIELTQFGLQVGQEGFYRVDDAGKIQVTKIENIRQVRIDNNYIGRGNGSGLLKQIQINRVSVRLLIKFYIGEVRDVLDIDRNLLVRVYFDSTKGAANFKIIEFSRC